MKPFDNPDVLAANHSSAPIGASQRTIAFTAIASGNDDDTEILITAADHGLKKHQYFEIASGEDYAGIHEVKAVVDEDTIRVVFPFVATDTGNLLLTAHGPGYGFYCDAVPLTITAIEPENAHVDDAAFIATEFIAGVWYPFEFKSIQISAGDITVVRKPIRATLAYTNR